MSCPITSLSLSCSVRWACLCLFCCHSRLSVACGTPPFLSSLSLTFLLFFGSLCNVSRRHVALACCPCCFICCCHCCCLCLPFGVFIVLLFCQHFVGHMKINSNDLFTSIWFIWFSAFAFTFFLMLFFYSAWHASFTMYVCVCVTILLYLCTCIIHCAFDTLPHVCLEILYTL